MLIKAKIILDEETKNFFIDTINELSRIDIIVNEVCNQEDIIITNEDKNSNFNFSNFIHDLKEKVDSINDIIN